MAGLLLARLVFSGSQREAPLISRDPASDRTDFYTFRSLTHPNEVIFLLNVIPAQDPSSVPDYCLTRGWEKNPCLPGEDFSLRAVWTITAGRAIPFMI